MKIQSLPFIYAHIPRLENWEVSLVNIYFYCRENLQVCNNCWKNKSCTYFILLDVLLTIKLSHLPTEICVFNDNLKYSMKPRCVIPFAFQPVGDHFTDGYYFLNSLFCWVTCIFPKYYLLLTY